jgi:excisionase family DNA binding protein
VNAITGTAPTTEFVARAAVTLYTTDEAAKILRVRKSWLERQAAARRVPFSLLGRSYRFTDAHLIEIVRIFEAGPTVSSAPPDRLSAVRSRRRSAFDAMPAQVQAQTPLRPRPRRAQVAT